MSEESDLIQINIIADVYVAAAHGGLSIEAALEADGRLAPSTYYYIKKSRPESIQAAMDKAESTLTAERTTQSRWLESLSAEVRDQMREKLLAEMTKNIETMAEVRDSAISDFTRLQAAVALTSLLDRFDQPPDAEKPKELPAPKRNALSAINSLLSSGAKEVQVSGGGISLTARLDSPT